MSLEYTDFERKMKRTCEFLTEQLAAVRAGKANPAVRGVTYTRMYKGRLVAVTAAGHGQFEYEGQLYPSLTACVKAITGTHYSGRKFFRLGGEPCSR